MHVYYKLEIQDATSTKTIGYGPSAVCYKMATEPNLKTFN
jgi:hypothetical protein